jgi:hypothetical protein
MSQRRAVGASQGSRPSISISAPTDERWCRARPARVERRGAREAAHEGFHAAGWCPRPEPEPERPPDLHRRCAERTPSAPREIA